MKQPELEFCFRISVDVNGGMQELGVTGKGIRRIIPITGGSFEGPNISGTVVPGGYDWQLVRTDGVVEIEARYLLKTRDGSLITVVNTGLRHGPVEVMQRLASGAEVDPSEYYFRSIPIFEIAAPEYDWMVKSVFIATGTRKPKEVLIDVWRVL